MTGAERRDKMNAKIKEITIPFIRSNGFKGSYPHFRREKDNKLNLLTFQFSLYSSQFVVEIANCPIEGYITPWDKYLKPAECRVAYFGNRLRVGSIKNKAGYWYNFEKESLLTNIYKKRAKEVIDNWEEAETWWQANPAIETPLKH